MPRILTLLPAAMLLFASCGSGSANKEGEALLAQAQAAFDEADYSLATHLLDSIENVHKADVPLQRRCMALRPAVIEKQTLVEIATSDSLIKADMARVEALKPQLKWVKNPRMIEGYWTYAKTYNPDFMNTTGIEARVNEIGQFYLVSSANPSSLKHVSVSLTADGRTATTPEVPYDGESNYRIGGGEVITFSPEQSDTIGALAAEAVKAVPSGKGNLTFNGAKGKKSIALSAEQIKGIAAAYVYSKAVCEAREEQVNLQRLNRKLEIARKQAAQQAARAEK